MLVRFFLYFFFFLIFFDFLESFKLEKRFFLFFCFFFEERIEGFFFVFLHFFEKKERDLVILVRSGKGKNGSHKNGKRFLAHPDKKRNLFKVLAVIVFLKALLFSG